jgi:hypothetical protein
MLLRWFVILLLSILPPFAPSGHAGGVPQEYLVKAKYLVNIPTYVELPPQALKGDTYTICLAGDTPLAGVLEPFAGKLVLNRPLAIKAVEETGQLERCQMLFIASSERHRLQTLLPEAQRRGILTISDMRYFTRLGGMISLQTVENRVSFEINLSAAKKASISFSSQLLKLARDIIK